jgi:hypothetical protein
MLISTTADDAYAQMYSVSGVPIQLKFAVTLGAGSSIEIVD